MTQMEALNSFDQSVRRETLTKLAQSASFTQEEPKPWVNMHMHTFFSFNGENASPSKLAWEAHLQKLYAIGICDFDVLTGLEEILWAGDMLKLRTAGGFETRTFFGEYADVEINSPGEPGVFYFMGMGFSSEPHPDSKESAFLQSMLEQSHVRNRGLITRINRNLSKIECNYDRDVLPLTPAGNATERHIVAAYYNLALEEAGGNTTAAADYWAEQLNMPAAEARSAMENKNKFLDLLRSKLMKKGGLGYEQPTRESFPLLDDVIKMIRGSKAIPVSTWLDGTSEGEADPEEQLECLLAKGVAAVNIIPDRNWNLAKADERARKISELNRYIKTAGALYLPVIVGTELNKPGQRFVDDFNSAALRPHLETFLNGAEIMVGQTRLLRYADFSYTGESAETEFPSRKDRNLFFAAVGALPPPAAPVVEKLQSLSPTQAYNMMQDSVKAEKWK